MPNDPPMLPDEDVLAQTADQIGVALKDRFDRDGCFLEVREVEAVRHGGFLPSLHGLEGTAVLYI